MRTNFINYLFLIASGSLAYSSACTDEFSKYESCIELIEDSVLKSENASEIQSMCEKFKDSKCSTFLADITNITSACDISKADEKDNASSILNRRIAYLKYCATDSTGALCPISGHLLEDFEEESGHTHAHDLEVSTFKNEEVKDRALTDWEGEWQSAYPYLLSGDLDAAFTEKSKDGKKTAEEYKEYYKKGYESNINKVTIKGNNISFTYDDGKTVSSDYDYLQPYIIDWSSGTRGVLYQFVAKDKNSGAPIYVEFNDHIIVPAKASHFHLRTSNESFESIDAENTWPTFFPANLNAEGIADEITGKAHAHEEEEEHDHDHEQAFLHELMDDCKIAECNKRYVNLVELLKLTGDAEAKDFEEYVSYYQKNDCDAIHDLEKKSDASRTMKMAFSGITLIIFYLFILFF